jgi:hypothetical protein
MTKRVLRMIRSLPLSAQPFWQLGQGADLKALNPERRKSMTITRNFAAAAAAMAVAASVVLAGPAQADDLQGLYNVHIDASANGSDPHDEKWVLTPCGAECLQIQHPAWAVLDTQAHLNGTTWTTPPVTIHPYCDDGSKYPLAITYSFDAATLQGTETDSWPASCGDPAGTDTEHFTLTKA